MVDSTFKDGLKVPASKVRQIAVLRALQLGDLLCSIPAFRTLRKSYPKSKISLIGLPNSQPLVERFHKYIDELIIFPGYPGLPEQEYHLAKFELFLQEMKNRKFELAIQMQGNGSIVNSLCAQFNPVYLAGFYPNDEDPPSPLFIQYPNYGHESIRHLLLLEHLGLKSIITEMEFPLFAKDFEDYQKLPLQPISSPYVCIHPGSRNSTRQWPISLFSKIGDFINKQGFGVILTGTEEEIGITQGVAAGMQYPPINLAGKTKLGTLAILLKNSTGLVSNCTGISHLSAALKVPSVIISMDGEPERWAPTNKKLHYTHDWLKAPDFERIRYRVKRMLTQIPF